MKLDKTRIAKTAIINNSLDPQWDEWFKVEVCHNANTLIFDIRDKDHAYTEKIGIVEISTHHLINVRVVEGWYNITRSGKVEFVRFSV